MRWQKLIQDNQKDFSRLQMLMDAGIIAVAYIVAWTIRFIGPFSYSAVRALTFQQYMFALIFIIPGYLLLYQAFTLYEPLSMQGRRLVLANIIKANVLGLLLVVFSLYMVCPFTDLLYRKRYAQTRQTSETDDPGRIQPRSRRVY